MMAHELFEKLGYLRELNDDYIVYVEKGNPWTYVKFINKKGGAFNRKWSE